MRRQILIIIALLVIFLFTTVQFTDAKGIEFKPQVSIGDDIQAGKSITISGTSIAQYIVTVYNWALRVIVILAIAMIIFAGFNWIMSAGNASAVGKAKEQITSSLIGLLIAFGSYMLLNFINPALVTFREIDLEDITLEVIGCRSDEVCVFNLPNVGNKSVEDCICQHQVEVPFYREKNMVNSVKVFLEVKADLDCGNVEGSGLFHIGTPNPKIGNKCPTVAGIKKECVIDGNYYDVSKNIALVAGFVNNTAKYGGAGCMFVNTEKDTTKKVTIASCSDATSELECNQSKSVCEWKKPYCLVKTKCGLNEKEKEMAGNRVFCCKIQKNIIEPYVYEYKYASRSYEDEAKNKDCSECGGADVSLTECKNFLKY